MRAHHACETSIPINLGVGGVWVKKCFPRAQIHTREARPWRGGCLDDGAGALLHRGDLEVRGARPGRDLTTSTERGSLTKLLRTPRKSN